MATVAAVIAQCDGQNMEDPDTAKQVALLSTVKSVMKTHIIRARQLGTPIGGGYLQGIACDLGAATRRNARALFSDWIGAAAD